MGATGSGQRCKCDCLERAGAQAKCGQARGTVRVLLLAASGKRSSSHCQMPVRDGAPIYPCTANHKTHRHTANVACPCMDMSTSPTCGSCRQHTIPYYSDLDVIHTWIVQFELILRREGLRSLYTGWPRSLAKNLPFDAALFVCYEGLKHAHLEAAAESQKRQVRQGSVDNSICGNVEDGSGEEGIGLFGAAALGAASGAFAGESVVRVHSPLRLIEHLRGKGHTSSVRLPVPIMVMTKYHIKR